MGSTKTPSPASACLAALAALCAAAAAAAPAKDAPPPQRPFDAKALQAAIDHPVNASGRVVAKNPADGTYEAEIDPRFPITGREHVYGSDTFDEEGMPDNLR